jgi:hypothetical protein
VAPAALSGVDTLTDSYVKSWVAEERVTVTAAGAQR